jgi:hypothetical protein
MDRAREMLPRPRRRARPSFWARGAMVDAEVGKGRCEEERDCKDSGLKRVEVTVVVTLSP